MLWSAISVYVKLDILRTSIVLLLPSPSFFFLSSPNSFPFIFISKSSMEMPVDKTEMKML